MNAEPEKMVHTWSRCYACFLDDIDGAMDLLGFDESRKQGVMRECIRILDRAIQDGHDREIPSWYITRVHRILKLAAGSDLLFADLRRTCNTVGLEVAAAVKTAVAGKPRDERLRAFMINAMAGNLLDFRTVGTGYGIDGAAARKAVEATVAAGLMIDERDAVIKLIDRAGNVLFIPDNVGEIALDKLLVDEMAAMGKQVTVPYRGGAITSDAVLADMEAVGMGEHARLIIAGPDTLGISMDEMSPELETAFAAADLCITKGQANFYFVMAYMDRLAVPAIACILTTKCRPISQCLGHDAERINVVTVAKVDGRPRLEPCQ
ncbi:MAG: ARMT1-like domain-containing protein [Planctomycetota bacterium]